MEIMDLRLPCMEIMDLGLPQLKLTRRGVKPCVTISLLLANMYAFTIAVASERAWNIAYF
jgi:hypothetical protein